LPMTMHLQSPPLGAATLAQRVGKLKARSPAKSFAGPGTNCFDHRGVALFSYLWH
jgi:hypothetical protein